MRALLLAAIVFAGGVAGAQTPMRIYELYVYSAADGDEVYAVRRLSRVTALEIEHGSARVAVDGAATLRTVRDAVADGDITQVLTDGPDSNIELGPDGDQDYDPESDDDQESASLVIVRRASAEQARHFIHQVPGSVAQRQQMLDTLGL